MLKNKPSISLDRTNYPLVVGSADKLTFADWETSGSTVELQAVVDHEVFTLVDVVWSSADPEIATVSDGLVQGRTTGFTTITASLPNGEQAVCQIAVIDNITRSTVLSLELNADQLVLGAGETAELIPIIYPEDVLDNGAMNREVDWSSSNPSVTVVDHKGMVTAVGVGEAEIAVQSRDVGRTAKCRVTVVEKLVQMPDFAKIGFAEWTELNLALGEKRQLVEESKRQQAVQVFWFKSTNSYIADVNESGEITAYSCGSAEILVTARNGGLVRKYPVAVDQYRFEVESVKISKDRVNLCVGWEQTLTAVVSPACILDQQVVWTSSDQAVVEVTAAEDTVWGAAQAVLKAVGAGQAVVTAYCKGRSASCLVTVARSRVSVSAVALADKLEIDVDQVLQLKASVNSDAVCQELVWLSSDRNTAAVNREGIVRGNQPGTVKIFAVAADSLDREQRAVVDELRGMRTLVGDGGCGFEKLYRLLSSKDLVWSACTLTVKESSPYLRNLHAPQEAVTADSALLLWNRASLDSARGLDHYRVYCGSELIAVTAKLGHTVKGLNPDTVYNFKVEAVSSDEEVLASASIAVTTKPAPPKVINVLDEPYRAVGSGKVMDTLAIQKAIDDCPEGGVVLLPAGCVFYSGALFLKSNMKLQVDGILIGSTDPKDYPPIVTRWNGLRKIYQPACEWESSDDGFDNQYAHASLINIGVYDEGERGRTGPYNVRNLVICGSGQINGNGFKLAYNEGPHGKTGNGGRPVPESTKIDASVRGRVITIHNAQHVYVADLTIAYGPAWTIHPIFCDSITFDNLEVISKGTGTTGAADDITILNGDGIDPDSATKINIFNCCFFTGDDAVAVKSGRNQEGNQLDKPSAYIRVTDCVSRGSKGGFCIGSEQSGGAHDILWQNLVVDSINLHGLWIKSNEARGGVVEDVLWRDCWIRNVNTGIYLNFDYNSSKTNPAAVPPEIRYITFENIHCEGMRRAGVRITGLAGSRIHDIAILGCSFKDGAEKEKAFWIRHGYNFNIENVKLSEGCGWKIENAKSVKIRE